MEWVGRRCGGAVLRGSHADGGGGLEAEGEGRLVGEGDLDGTGGVAALGNLKEAIGDDAILVEKVEEIGVLLEDAGDAVSLLGISLVEVDGGGLADLAVGGGDGIAVGVGFGIAQVGIHFLD